MFLLQIIRGLCMAVADSVPGVSGGTIAFLLGFYDFFIANVDDLLTGNWQKKKKAFLYLIQIGIGWAIGMVLSILALTKIFESHIYAISSVFIGLIIFAIPLVVKDELTVLKKSKWSAVFILIGIAVVVVVTMVHPPVDFDLAQLTPALGLYVVLCGFISMAVMILPGMSGSTTLLILGMYLPILNAVKDFLHLNFSVLPVILLFVLGVVLGVALASKGIHKALERFRPQMIYLIIGLMLGSIYAVMQGPTSLDVPREAMDFSTFHIGFFLLGGAIIVGLQKLSDLKIFHKNK